MSHPEFTSQTTIIIFLIAGSFAFASAAFIKELLISNTKKLTRNLIKSDRKRQEKIIMSIKGLFLGKDNITKKEYVSYKATTKRLTKELSHIVNKFKKKSSQTIEEEFEQHQSIAFSFGIFSIGYLILIMLFTIEELLLVNILVVYIGLYFFYLSYIIFGVVSPILATFTVLTFFVYENELSLSDKFLITEVFLFYFYIFIFSIKSKHFGIFKKVSTFTLYKVYRKVLSKNTKKVLIDINISHYINLIKYATHFIIVLLLISTSLYSENILGINLVTLELYYFDIDIKETPYKALLSIVLAYFITIIIYPIYKLNRVFHKEIKIYILERNKVWDKREFIELIKLKTTHEEYISMLNTIEENLTNKFNT